MKKLLFVNLVLVCTISLHAQTTFGLKAGVNFASWTGVDADGSSTLTGFNVGGVANFPVSPKFAVQPELTFSQEGVKETGGTGKIITGYINIPVLLQYISNPVSGVYAVTGPQLGILISAKAKDGGTSEDVKSQFKSTAISWLLGLGYKLTNGLGFDARYAFGLSKIPAGSGTGTDVKSNCISINIIKTFGSYCWLQMDRGDEIARA